MIKNYLKRKGINPALKTWSKIIIFGSSKSIADIITRSSSVFDHRVIYKVTNLPGQLFIHVLIETSCSNSAWYIRKRILRSAQRTRTYHIKTQCLNSAWYTRKVLDLIATKITKHPWLSIERKSCHTMNDQHLLMLNNICRIKDDSIR